MANNAAAAAILREMALRLELEGANRFRIRSYQKAAQTLSVLIADIASLSFDELAALPSVGRSIAAHISEILQTGTFAELEHLRTKFPSGVLDLMRINGIGPKRTAALYNALGIDSSDKLRDCAKRGLIRPLEGFGEHIEQNILAGIAAADESDHRLLHWPAARLAEEITAYLRPFADSPVLITGSLRRGCETVGNIDLLARANPHADILRAFATAPFCGRVLTRKAAEVSIVLKNGRQCTLRLARAENFGAAEIYYTGSKEHLALLGKRAESLGMSFGLNGLARQSDGAALPAQTEEAVYSALGLPFIPPDLREGTFEFERPIPALVTEKDIKGDFHSHTVYSDGSGTMAQMCGAAAALGHEWFALGDHSQRLGVAKGISMQQYRETKKELAALGEQFPAMQLLRSLEVEILADGEMDFPDEDLKDIDVVIGAIHSGPKDDAEKLTKRILGAIKNPYVDILAHPTGRIISKRPSYVFDEELIFSQAAAAHTALEINGQPDRQDLSPEKALRAHALGAKIALSSDAHAPDQLAYIKLAVRVARRAWLTKADILNCLSYKELKDYL